MSPLGARLRQALEWCWRWLIAAVLFVVALYVLVLVACLAIVVGIILAAHYAIRSL